MEVSPMPRPKGSKNKPKTVKSTVDFAAQITEKQAAKKAAQDDEAVQAAVKAVLKHLVTLVVFWCASLVRSLWCA